MQNAKINWKTKWHRWLLKLFFPTRRYACYVSIFYFIYYSWKISRFYESWLIKYGSLFYFPFLLSENIRCFMKVNGSIKSTYKSRNEISINLRRRNVLRSSFIILGHSLFCNHETIERLTLPTVFIDLCTTDNISHCLHTSLQSHS